MDGPLSNYVIHKLTLWPVEFSRSYRSEGQDHIKLKILCSYQWPSRGVDPGDIRGNSAGFANFVANFWPGMGALDLSCTSEARYTGKDPRDL